VLIWLPLVPLGNERGMEEWWREKDGRGCEFRAGAQSWEALSAVAGRAEPWVSLPCSPATYFVRPPAKGGIRMDAAEDLARPRPHFIVQHEFSQQFHGHVAHSES